MGELRAILYIKTNMVVSVCLFRDMETGGIVSYGSVCPIISRPEKRDLKIRISPSDLHN
jgi:hypothetical protein